MLTYIWENRIRERCTPKEGLRRWARRAFELPALLQHVFASGRLQLRGACISQSAVLSDIEVHGPPKHLVIGAFSSIGRAYFQCHAPIVIGDCVVINDGVRLLTGSHDIDSETYEHVFKPIEIDQYAWIASSAIILQGVSIGYGAVVAAGAVVTRDVPSLSVVAGNPARVVRVRRDASFNYRPSTWFAPIQAWIGRK